MVDISIVALLNNSLIQGVSQSNSTQASGGGNAGNALSSLPAGTVLNGVISGRDNRGNAILRTDRGDVVLKSDAILRRGAQVSIILDTGGASPKARILSVDGAPPKTPAGPLLSEDGVTLSSSASLSTGAGSTGNSTSRPTPTLADALARATGNTNAANTALFQTSQNTNIRTSTNSLTSSLIKALVLSADEGASSDTSTSFNRPATGSGATANNNSITPSTIATPRLPVGQVVTIQVLSVTLPNNTAANAPPGIAATANSATNAVQNNTPQINAGSVSSLNVNNISPTSISVQNVVGNTISSNISNQAPNLSSAQATPNANSSGIPINTTTSTTPANIVNNSAANASAINPASTLNSGVNSSVNSGASPAPNSNTVNNDTAPFSRAASLLSSTGGEAAPQNSAINSSVATANLTAAGKNPAAAANTPSTNLAGVGSGAVPAAAGNSNAAAASPAGGQASGLPNAANAANAAKAAPANLSPPSPSAGNTNASAGSAINSLPANIAATGEGEVALPQTPLQGRVVANSPAGEAIIQTPNGTLKLPSSAPLPIGTTLRFSLQTGATSLLLSELSGLAGTPPAALGALSRDWATLGALTAFTQATAPQLAAALLSRIVPQVGPQLLGSTLFFLSALRGGDVRTWVGEDVIEHLESRGLGSVVKRLSAEFMTLRSAFIDTPPNQPWQALFMPIAYHDAVEQMRIFIKREDKEKNNEKQGKKKGNRRFIVEVTMSEFGPLQMDGLVRKEEKNTQFDMVLRTHTPLPDAMIRDIQGIFHTMGEATGFQGVLQFQHMPIFPVQPMEEGHILPVSNIIA